jgi:hypothetical protein
MSPARDKDPCKLPLIVFCSFLGFNDHTYRDTDQSINSMEAVTISLMYAYTRQQQNVQSK